jgi:hypothetical protein
VDAREPPIATLPRQTAAGSAGTGVRAELARSYGERMMAWPAMAGAGIGYARHAARLERRLGWILWGALFVLVLARSL